MMKRTRGFLGSTFTGLMPSSTPPCGVALFAWVACATAEETVDDIVGVVRETKIYQSED